MSDHTAVLLAARARALTLQVATTDGDYSRASTATYVNASGVVTTAAIDEARTAHYVGATLTRLYEAAATNLCLRSEAFDDAAWTKSRTTVTANGDVAPDGTTTAERLIEDSTPTSTHRVFSAATFAITADSTVTASAFLKAGTRTWALLSLIDSSETNAARVYVNLATGAMGSSMNVGTGSVTTSGSTALGNGWYRVWLAGTLGGGITAARLSIGLSTGDSGGSYSGDGASYLLAWGAQAENGVSAPTSYIPTAGTTVTRAADVGGLAATTTGYTRTVGSFLTDGFAVGMEVTPSGFTTTTPATITDVTATTMTVDTARTADLIAGGRTLTVGLPAVRAWENVDATPVTGQPWVEESYLPGAVEQVTVTATGMLEVLPLYTLTLRTKLGIGMTALLAYADAVLAHFAPGLALTLTDGTDLRVRTRPAPFATPIVRGDTWAACAVTIPLRHHTPNPR